MSRRTIIAEQLAEVARLRADLWTQVEENAELRTQIVVLEAIVVEQEKELATLNRTCDRIALAGISHE